MMLRPAGRPVRSAEHVNFFVNFPVPVIDLTWSGWIYMAPAPKPTKQARPAGNVMLDIPPNMIAKKMTSPGLWGILIGRFQML